MQITINLEDNYKNWLKIISKENLTTEKDLVRSFIINYIKEYRLRKGIREYTEGKVSLGKAAEIADIPKRKFRYKLREYGIPLNVNEKDFIKGIETLSKNMI